LKIIGLKKLVGIEDNTINKIYIII